uniref:Uncharacterized protein n=1 Tax=Panagrolaimus superbus TaxID=310955 RepID=A0A914YMU4_9BILA
MMAYFVFLFISLAVVDINCLILPSNTLPINTIQNKDSFQCDNGWHWLQSKKTCISIQDTPLNWSDAESQCVTLGTHLISIDNAFEEDAAKNVMQQYGTCDYYWIGAKRGADGNFSWSDKNQFSYSNFGPGGDNNPRENCTDINERSTFWRTLDCSDKNCFICENPDPSNLPDFAIYTDCAELKEAGQTKNGFYYISTKTGAKKVFCDMEVNGGGWVVIQQRVDETLKFWNQKWNAYKQGFGFFAENSNFWIGNDLIHELSSKDAKVILRIELWGDQNPTSPYKNDYWWSEFNFQLEDESTDYTLHASILQRYPNDWKGTGNASTNWYDVTCEEGVKFSTVDKINDPMSKCVTDYHLGGWWLHYCSTVSLNGEYKPAKYADGYGFMWLIDGEYMINPIKSRMLLRKLL